MAIIRDIAKLIASKHQLKQTEADHFVQSIIEVINDGLANDRQVKIKGFGTFKLQAVKDRSSVNISTGERVIISGHDKITFTPDNVMRDIINKPFAHFETVIVEEDSPLLDETIELDEEREDKEYNEIMIETAVSSDNSVEILQSEIAETAIEDNKGIVAVEKDAVAVEKDVVAEDKEGIADTKEDNIEKKSEDVIEKNEGVLESNAVITEEPIEEIPTESAQEQVAEETPLETVPEETVTETPKVLSEDTSDCDETSTAEETSEVENAEEEQMEDDMNTCPGQYNRCRNIFIYYGILINVIVAIIAFVCGYMYSEYRNSCYAVPETKIVKQKTVTEKAKNNGLIEEKTAVGNDTTTKKEVKKETEVAKPETVEKEQKTKETSVKANASEPKKEEANAKPKVAEPKKDEIKPLNFDSDPRVRTGAYYIIGTELEVTVKEGQTLKSISKAYLGADMECYVEAYNNKKEVKAGDKVRIPKLILKKRLKK